MRNKKSAVWLWSLVLLCSASGPLFADEFSVVSVPTMQSPATLQSKTVNESLRSTPFGFVFSLVTLTSVDRLRIQAMTEKQSLPAQVGFSRNIDMLLTPHETSRQLSWQELPDGSHIGGVVIHSPQALALRLGLTVNKLPENTELRFFGSSEEGPVDIHLVPAQQILDILQQNREADPDSPEGEIFWSPTVNGDTVGMEIYLPEDYEPSLVDIAVPLLSHISLLPFGSEVMENTLQAQGGSDPCQNDATCAASWSTLSKSVAGMQFTSSGGTYVCTGSLLNDSDPDSLTPFFLTANHCISTQAEASSLETHWSYQSSTCDGSTLSSAYQRITGGATLLHTRGLDAGVPTDLSMDTTLLRLNKAAPAGAVFAGWSTAPPPGYGSSRVGIHHPQADWKKISYGVAAGTLACGWNTGTEFSCTSGEGNFYQVNWTSGGTEGGSSGSALYSDNGQIIATLSGGNGSCAGSSSVYSSFRTAFEAGDYGQWLSPPPPEPEPEPEPEPPPPVIAPINFLLLR